MTSNTPSSHGVRVDTPGSGNGNVVDWDDDEVAQQKSRLCCLEGCLAVSAIAFSFFVALPTGIILLVLAINSHDEALMSVGGVLISLPVIMFVLVLTLCLNQQRISRLLPWRLFAKKTNQGKTSAQSIQTVTGKVDCTA